MINPLRFHRYVINFYVLNKKQLTVVPTGYRWTANFVARGHLDNTGMYFANGYYTIEQIPEG